MAADRLADRLLFLAVISAPVIVVVSMVVAWHLLGISWRKR